MKRSIVFSIVFLIFYSVHAQFTIKGNVKDNEGSPLVGANIELTPLKVGAISDINGNFSFRDIPEGEYTLRVSFIGFTTFRKQFNLSADNDFKIVLEPRALMTDEVIVTATRASEKTPTTYSILNKKEIEKMNLGQDIPFILNQAPSTFVTSDAGNGIGYTSMRIRGTDQTRINVTINGIPLNDAESHGVFWVDLPDFASSVENIQIQRGVGTSTNGAAAFGASVNIQAEQLNPEPYAQLDAFGGSFNTRKATLQLGSGLIKDRFTFDVRVSDIYSDGYIDRAYSDLRSYYVSGGYYGKNSLIRMNIFSGAEKTYQAWWGTPEARVKGDEEALDAHINRSWYTEEEIENLLNSGRTYNYYTCDNETDNYKQDHYQLIFAQDIGDIVTFNGALHYTYGRGYYEQFREDDPFSDYSLDDLYFGYDSIFTGPGYTYFYHDTISSTDLIRQRWLDNDFYGFVISTEISPSDKLQLVFGGGWNRYEGDHFGEIIWARFAGYTDILHRYYDNSADKKDLHFYGKGYYQLNSRLNLFIDLQYRYIEYTYDGMDNDQRSIEGQHSFDFFNPKFGLTYGFTDNSSIYASYGIGNREPVRTDFIDAPADRIPEHETLRNLELGYKKSGKDYALQINYYLMDYKNQLVLNGELNDVGSSLRQNVDRSYRTGIELTGAYRFSKTWNLNANVTYSWNKIQEFEEILYNYDDYSVVINEYTNTDISYSPNLIFNTNLVFTPISNLDISWMSKYVSSQYLDNTSNDARKLDSFFVNDLMASYSFTPTFMREIRLNAMVNNILNVLYEPNGYTYSYIYGAKLITENFLYPMAGTHFMVGVVLKF
jgi:iron complex outermembrane receptor protein